MWELSFTFFYSAFSMGPKKDNDKKDKKKEKEKATTVRI